jgi:hypothetical protein
MNTKICKFTLKLPDQEDHLSSEITFDFEIDDHSIRYAFDEGNYSCDCNKSAFLCEAGLLDVEYPCGDTIELISLEIREASADE